MPGPMMSDDTRAAARSLAELLAERERQSGSSQDAPAATIISVRRPRPGAAAAPDPDMERTLRIWDAVLPGYAGSRAAPGMMQMPREWKQQVPGVDMAVGIDPLKLQPGDLDKPPLWETLPPDQQGPIYSAIIAHMQAPKRKRRG